MISTTEDVADLARAGEGAAVRARLAILREELAGLGDIVDGAALAAARTELASADAAAERNDLTGASLDAIDIFRILDGSLDYAGQPVPQEVALLDYAGFRLRALAMSNSPDWTAIEATAAEAHGFWQRAIPRLNDRALADLSATIDRGLGGTVGRRDTAGVVLTAQLTLDVVDLLEHHFANAH